MAQAKLKTAWDQTAQILALIANVNRDPKKSKPFSPADFHPYREKSDYEQPAVSVSPDEIRRAIFNA